MLQNLLQGNIPFSPRIVTTIITKMCREYSESHSAEEQFLTVESSYEYQVDNFSIVLLYCNFLSLTLIKT